MEKNTFRFLSLALIALLGIGFLIPLNAHAEEGTGAAADDGTNISLSPVSKVLQLESESVYEDSFKVTNNGKSEIKVEVYAAPYSYVYSENDGIYQLGFNNENNFTQISRWIRFKSTNGEFEEKPQFIIPAGETLAVQYRISTPSNIPPGGQYAVMFAHTLSDAVAGNGIRTEASPGIIVYGRSSEGEVITTGEISGMTISNSIVEDETTKNLINASAKIKNTGNVDFSASGVLKIQGLFGGDCYETSGGRGLISVIPESELVVSDKWDDTPSFGIFRATWTVNAAGETEVIEQIVFVNIMPLIIITIIVLTILIIWITIMVRRRKERRSRLAV